MRAKRLEWLGDSQPSLDMVSIWQVGRAAMGAFGGSSGAGAYKNEDAALVWDCAAEDWTFAAVLDAHGSAQSARAVLDTLAAEYSAIAQRLAQPSAAAFADLERHLLDVLGSPSVRGRCAHLSGETALLCVAQKGEYLWWFSVGDSVVYLLHPDLAQLGQYALNQRHFFQRVGEMNTFAQACATYSSGRFMLRRGKNDILLLTDGVLEFGERPFEDSEQLAAAVCGADSLQEGIHSLLGAVQRGQGRDSATVVGWRVFSEVEPMHPSA